MRRGRLRRRDLQPVVQADPRRPALPAVRQPAPGLRRADRTPPPDADGAASVPADRVRVSGVSRREPAPRHAGRRHRDVQRARALAPARARPQAVRPRALRPGAAPAHRRPRRRDGLRRLPDRRRPPRARERHRRGGLRRHRRQPPARRDPAARSPRPRHRRRARRTARRARGSKPARASCSARPVRSPTASSPSRRPTACARRSASTWCSTPPASPTAAARWCCARPATTGCSSSCPPARAPSSGRPTRTGRRPDRPRLDDDIRARGEDVAYLLEAANHAFPDLRLAADDVLSTFAALRPLLATSAHTPSETSREHEIARAANGLLVIAGGKLTTLRRMGEDAVDRSIEALHAAGLERALDRCATGDRPLPGGGPPPASLAQAGLPPDVTARLAAAYGSRAGAGGRGSRPTRRRWRGGSIPSFRTSGPRSFTRFAPSTRAPSPTCCRRRVPLYRDAPRPGTRRRRRCRRRSWPPSSAWPAARRAPALLDYRNAVERSRRWREELAAQKIVMTPSTARSRA